MDVKIVIMLRKKPTVLPMEALNDINKMRQGKMEKDNWSVTFQKSSRDGTNVHRCLFCLPDKHLYSTSCLNYVLEITKKNKGNDAADKKCFTYMIKWYILLHKTLRGLIPKLFMVQKRIHQRRIFLPY